MNVSKMNHALLSLALLGHLSVPARRSYGRPPPAPKGQDAKSRS